MSLMREQHAPQRTLCESNKDVVKAMLEASLISLGCMYTCDDQLSESEALVAAQLNLRTKDRMSGQASADEGLQRDRIAKDSALAKKTIPMFLGDDDLDEVVAEKLDTLQTWKYVCDYGLDVKDNQADWYEKKLRELRLADVHSMDAYLSKFRKLYRALSKVDHTVCSLKRAFRWCIAQMGPPAEAGGCYREITQKLLDMAAATPMALKWKTFRARLLLAEQQEGGHRHDDSSSDDEEPRGKKRKGDREKREHAYHTRIQKLEEALYTKSTAPPKSTATQPACDSWRDMQWQMQTGGQMSVLTCGPTWQCQCASGQTGRVRHQR